MKPFLLSLILGVFLFYPLAAQFNFDLGPKNEVVLSFEATNNFIIMDVRFANVLPLKFIFDTGSEHTLLFKKEYADLLGIEYERKIPLMGSDLSQTINGFIARGINLNIANAYAVKTDILVLEEDYLRLEESTGVQIDGILGANVFKYFVMHVNNKKHRIKLSKNEIKKRPSGYTDIPVTIYKNKPYVTGRVRFGKDTTDLTLLLDTGAGLPILLYTNTSEHLELPEKTVRGSLGMGLGGHLEGYIGRLDYFSYGSFHFDNILSSYQEIHLDEEDILDMNRNGIIGNSVLSRFNFIIDYPRQKLFAKPRRRLKRKFKYDRSGLFIAATGRNLKDFIIQDVLPNTPAEEAGLRKGDVIKRIEGVPASFHSLGSVHNILSKRVGRIVKLNIARDDKRIVAKVKLRDII